MKTGTTLLAVTGLLVLGACTSQTPAENASRNLSQTAENAAADIRNTADEVRADLANQTEEMRNVADNARNVIEQRAGRVREATGNSIRDIGNAAEGR
jgi:hypothetical protein